MASIAVIGEERHIYGFKPFGVDVYFADTSLSNEELEELFRNILKRKYTLIMITEGVARKIQKQVDALWEKELPVVLTIRSLQITSRMAFERLRGLVVKAIGTDFLKEG